MHVHQVVVAGHELRIAGMRGDETVEALAEVSDGHRTCGRGSADGEIQIEQCRSRVIGRKTRLPADARRPHERRISCVDGRLSKSGLRVHGKCLRPLLRLEPFGQTACCKNDVPGGIAQCVWKLEFGE
jgi:hypothetical protein